jgi:hypothetical protein
VSAMTPAIAIQLLSDAGQKNPGPWTSHSLLAGLAARRIAQAEGTMDPDYAQSLGLLHDIGRIRGPTGLRHVSDGYHYLVSLGYPECAVACLSHSFPDKCLDSYLGPSDVDAEDRQLIESYLREAQFSDYDRLVQLCDFLATGSGYCLLEVRMVDVVLRHKIVNVPTAKWNVVFAIMKEFDRRIGKSIYTLLPGIVGGTFVTTDLLELKMQDPEWTVLR